ncbi:MAG: hypothetical protein P1U89_12395 [Verrucomicrobiales bacterium]|nr:hypothetical protein [Verrucomicrobiales bacterium]
MIPEKPLLVFITACLVWLAITYGAYLPDIELRSPTEGTTMKGYQVLGIRCGFLFLAFISMLFLLDHGVEDESKSEHSDSRQSES